MNGWPLAFGDRVAWTNVSYGKTDGLSSIHRAFEDDQTFCGEEIPAAIRRFPALRSLNVCSTCERLFQEHKNLVRQSA